MLIYDDFYCTKKCVNQNKKITSFRQNNYIQKLSF